MPIEMIPRGEPSEREMLEEQLRSLQFQKTGLEEQLLRESQDGVEPLDAEDLRSDIRDLLEQIAVLQNRIDVIDGARMPDDKDGQGEMFPL